MDSEEGPPVAEAYAAALADWGRRRPDGFALTSDAATTHALLSRWRVTHPTRFVAGGTPLPELLGMALGLAADGGRPVLHGPAAQLLPAAVPALLSLARPLPLRLVGLLDATDASPPVDLALAAAVPSLTVFEPGDLTELTWALEEADRLAGPAYLRLSARRLPARLADAPPAAGRVLQHGSALSIVSCGEATVAARAAASSLAARGTSVHLLHVTRLAPLDGRVDAAIELGRSGIVTLERHAPSGGLATRVAERIAAFGEARRLVPLTLDGGDAVARLLAACVRLAPPAAAAS